MANEIDNNTSYTNKDFQSIYAELLNTIPNLTNKWNPSNEADPGVVLTKLIAILGDKLNYNIDKQVLECFPGSVTQRKNARSIFNLVGYKMSWYKSASVNVGFKLKAYLDDPLTSVVIPRFTQLTDVNKTLSFITTADVLLYGNDITTIKEIKAIQGNLNSYVVNGSSQIKLSNLDENYKIYFSDINVAQNGIFVADYNSSPSARVYDWQQVDNVDSYPLGSKVYEFGINDDETQCYLKFPSDVNDVTLSDSLSIDYIVSNGLDGNILSNVLDTFTQSISDTTGIAVEDRIAVIQTDATNDGEDPETIEHAYKESRRVVGTFGTLVTKIDFQNYIRQLKEGTDNIISNVVVTDRNSDLNQVAEIKSIENFSTYDRTERTGITAYDLVLYMLKAENKEYSSADEKYNSGFIPVTDEETKLIIENELDDVKAINIDLKLPSTDASSYALFKGMYGIVAEIVTSEKITRDEADVLEASIKLGLEKAYKSSNVEFGEFISYSNLIDTISQLDSRIKAVSLRDVSYTIKKVLSNGDVQNLSDADKLNIVARSIARGNIQLYNFLDSFNIDFGQTNGAIVTPIKLKTYFTSTLSTSSTTPLTLQNGELVSLYAPLIKNTTNYTNGCRLTWTPSSGAGSISGVTTETDAGGSYLQLAADTYFQVGTGSGQIGTINVIYYDSSNIKQTVTIDGGLLIKCNQPIISNKKEQIIRTGNTFSIYDESTSSLISGTKYILHLDNVSASTKTINANSELLLKTNDLFVYYETVSASWVQLGSGYTLRNTSGSAITLNLLSSINTANYSELPAGLTIVDNDIITLNKGCTIQYTKDTGVSTGTFLLSSAELALTAGYNLVVVDTSGQKIFNKNAKGQYYKAFTRLDLVYGVDPIVMATGESIQYSVDGTNFITIVNTTADASQDGIKRVQFSKPVSVIGSENISMSGIDLYYYTLSTTLPVRTDGIIEYPVSTSVRNVSLSVLVTSTTTKLLLPIHVEALSTAKVSALYDTTGPTSTNNALYSMDQYKSGASLTNTYATGDYILNVPKNVTVVKFTVPVGSSLQVGKLLVVSNINTEDINDSNNGFTIAATENLSDSTLKETQLVYAVNSLSDTYHVDYTYRVKNNNKCAKPTDPINFFDKDHVFNPYVIAQMDTGSAYSVIINKFSIKD